jgi:hypothetical protein
MAHRLRTSAKKVPASRSGAVDPAICGQLGGVGTELLAGIGPI